MLNDIRYSLRTLRQNPGFALTAIISIALAVGANSAIFTMADGLVLGPLPVPNPSSVVTIGRARQAEISAAGMVSISHSLEQSFPLTNRSIGSIVMTELKARHDFDNGDQQLVGALGTIGLLLALVGLYAVVSYQVSRRTREIGIRMAIGAARPQVLAMILRQAGMLALTGVGIGTILSPAGHGVLNAGIGAQVFPFDPLSVTAIVASLLGTTLLAAAIPARHASKIDPQRTLRQE